MLGMNILMGFTVSLILSLVGTLTGGHFTLMSWLVSFGISFVISLIIGFLVPMKKIGDKACEKANIPPMSFKGNLLSGLISDLIYTPIITIIMVYIMLGNAAKQMRAAGVPEQIIQKEIPSFGRVVILSLAICFLVAYVVIVIAQPCFIKLLTKKMSKKEMSREQR